MKKEIKQTTREQRVKVFISKWKFLSNPKYYKNIDMSWAAYDSFAAKGQAGNCNICGIGHYNCSFRHKRFTTKMGERPQEYHWNEFGNICSACFGEVEKQCNYKFIKD